MLVYLRLLKESLGFAMNALRNNKLRTLLSLLGVTIGIFSIIAVLAAVDSLDRKITKDLSSLDKNTIYLMKFSFGPSEIPQWKREQFPNVKYDEYNFMKGAMTNTDQMAYQIFTRRETIKYESKTVSDINIVPVSHEFIDIQGLEFDKGRFYNESEANSGATVIVLGNEIAKSLFEESEPIGKNVRLYGKRFTVIGVIKKEGSGLFGDSNDTSAYIPVNFVRQLYGDNNTSLTNVIIFKPEKGVDMDAYKSEISQKLRSFRGLKAGEIDNFFINVFSGFTDLIDGILGQMNVVGWIISGFSLLVGGFGIANIMFVSVKERTNLIGIQKSLGAKNRFILFQFLFEAIILSVIGGMIGLFLVWIISVILTKALDFEFVLSAGNIILGTGLAAVIGLISGILPAISASKLDPVEAIRTGM
ncbi:MAG: ABC transporter permease [Flavobacterium sp.]|jgi:putative ABC transport system permease protein|uniref:ABC transporter permease n=1 Tax=Flavobacterium algoritolerans TaxID=3041254 RepID=A0ABT6VAJ1_9FLAO|nr:MULTISPECIES: ABC transporter permease [Flavobacterium]MDI5895253.1 ABC transporter permease [Flavobacterium algoritolerans]MDP3679359.1 ABC transporter permease [Flavobacterium sp.]MDZ4331134.1 ABC transporter permease [Flavobacterium sp.]PIF60920.1 putative ABC transport system permease protein [Flavobacterium sp. 11]WKL45308.1 ABC transporter permease [Flavobacterium sp. ZE23DGlu08]